MRRQAADRRRLGVDELGLPAVPGVRGLAVQGVFGGVFRPGVQGAARRVVRGQPGGLPGHVPQLGLPDQEADLRRFPHRPRCCFPGGTTPPPPPYVGTWPTSGRPPRCARFSSTRRTALYRQAWAPRGQRHGTVNADGFGVGGTRQATRPRPGYRRAVRSGRRVLHRHCPGDVDGRAAGVGALRDGGHRPGDRRGRAVRVGTLAVQPQRRAGRLAGVRRRARRDAARRSLLGLEAQVDSALLWALIRHRLELGLGAADALAGTAQPTPKTPICPLSIVAWQAGAVKRKLLSLSCTRFW